MEISILSIVYVVAVIVVALIVYICVRVSLVKVRRAGELQRSSVNRPEMLDGVSVVIYCRDEPEKLARMLPTVLAQDYPGAYEVIVVNDGDSEEVKDVAKLLLARHRNLRVTFVPQQAHSLSRRKLAMMLGAKGAQNPYLVFTTADVMVDTVDWLRALVEPLAHDCGMVLGHVAPKAGEKGGHHPMKHVDRLFETCGWMSQALGEKAYCGDSRNMAMRRQLFFDNRGFASSLNLHAGHDDILVEEIGRRGRVAVALLEDGILCSEERSDMRRYGVEKMSHMFTSRYLSHTSRGLLNMLSFSLGLMFAIVIAGIVYVGVRLPEYELSELVGVGAGFLCMASVWAYMSVEANRVARLLKMRVSGFWAPVLMSVRPLYNVKFRLGSMLNRRRNYTWS